MSNATYKFYNADGRVSAYGFRTGLGDTFHLCLADNVTVAKVTLTYNGSSYDVQCAHNGEWADTANGGRVLAGWAQFNTLGEARAFIHSIPRLPNKRALWEQCALTVGSTLAHNPIK